MISFYVKACEGEVYKFDEFKSEFVPRVGEKVTLYYAEFSSIAFRVTEVSYTFGKNKCIGIQVHGEEGRTEYELRVNINNSAIPQSFNLKG